ncbi:MAG: histone family protein [Candidatus Methanomethylicia archaeon]|nr:histone family protein [Candidatus Methanomethylicia archaeon]MCX8168939.1 histone family protein [Candidatus Methanomethylicia archaeon]MDW7988671.1 histone family protein [Nitrososphaerota archaeon]
MPELPLAPIERLIRKAGAYRVSVEAAEALREVLEEIAIEISKEAIELAQHANRRTVTGDDIKLATRRFQKSFKYPI